MRDLFGGLSLAALALLTGCAAAPDDQGNRAEGPARPDLAAVRTIRLECGQSGGIPGAPRDVYVLELSAAKPCRATVAHGNNWDGNGETKTYDLPADTFREVKEALSAADFFAMKDSHPEALFENSAWWVSVTCDGEFRHSVNVTHPAPAPKGFREIFALALKAEQKGTLTGKEAGAVGPAPPINPRRP